MTRVTAVMTAMQLGLPLVARPFDALGQQFDLSGAQLVDQVNQWIDSGLVRRFGGVFHSPALGYAGVLCAVACDASDREGMIESICRRASVTHCYTRSIDPDLWFTVTCEQDRLAEELAAVKAICTGRRFWVLPSRRRFKTQVIFGGHGQTDPGPVDWDVSRSPIVLDGAGRHLVSLLQSHRRPVVDWFDQLAHAWGRSVEELLGQLQDWQRHGALKRIGVILHHQRAGYTANAMCLWSMDESQIDRVGRALASRAEVTHCYHRSAPAGMAFNLYAMMHGSSRDDLQRQLSVVCSALNLPMPLLAWTEAQHKKSSPVFVTDLESR